MNSDDRANDYIMTTMKKLGQRQEILKEIEQYAAENNVPIVKPDSASLILVLGKLVKPVRILEIGTAIGYSAILLSSCLEAGGRTDTIERSEKMVELAKTNITKAGCKDSINVIAGEASEILKCLEGKYDMIFLDAAKAQYIEFLPDCLRLLKDGGLLVTDNVLYRGMVAMKGPVPRGDRTIVTRLREYLDAICNNEMLDTCILQTGDGVAVTYKRGG